MALPPGFTIDKPQEQPKSGLPPGFKVDQSSEGDSESDGSVRAGIEDFLQGVNTGIAGDVVGVGQLARHVLPDSLTNWIANSRAGQRLSEMAQQPSKGWAGTAGNLAGAALPFVLTPGLKAAEGWGPASRVLTRSTIPAATQPVDPNDPDYWGTKALQTAIGTGAGELLHGLSSLGGRALSNIKNSRAAQSLRDLVLDINRQIRDENVGRQTAFEGRRDRVEGINERIKARNTGIDERFQGEQERQRQQTHLQRQAVQAAKQAQDAVPGQVTQRWWQEALAPIGEQARAPRTNTPEASAQVRRIVGDRLNQIRGQMRIGRDDAGFRTDIDGIRDRIEARLSNQGIRDQWAYTPEQRFDAQGNELPPTAVQLARQQHSVWSKFVEQPLENLPELSGRQMADYVSRLGDLAEQYARRAMSAPQAERPELEAISQGLRQVVDVVDRRGVSDPEMATQLASAKRAYHLWSIGNSAVDITGTMTPRNITRAWMRRQGGPANYGAEMDSGNPRYHHANAQLKQQLERARDLHETGPPPVTLPAPVPRPTTKWATIPAPRRPTPIQQGPLPPMPSRAAPSAGAQAAHAVGRKIVAHSLGGLPGVLLEPLATAAGRRLARSPTAARGLSEVGRAGPAAAVAGSQAVTPIPEIVVTAKRPKPEEQQ